MRHVARYWDTDVHAVLWFDSFVLQRKDCFLFLTGTRRGMSDGGRANSYLRSISSASLDVLGDGA
jgi:hypothetical protein